jgi:glycosyltransferase involved in cell wall biosynthesis
VRIAIDARNLQTWARYRGGGYYTLNLVRELSRLDRSDEFLILVRGRPDLRDLGLDGLGDNFRLLSFPVPSLYGKVSWLLDEMFLTRFLEERNLDIFHQPDPFKTLYSGTGASFRTAIMVHDFIPVFYPPPFSPRSMAYGLAVRSLMRRIRSADRVLVNSENTMRDVVRLLDFPRERVTVACPAVSFSPLPAKEDRKKEIKKKYGLGRRHILYVGGLEERKNIERLLRAFRKCLDDLHDDVILVMAGWDGNRRSSPGYLRAIRLIGELDLGGKVVFTGFIPEEDLAALYASAELFFFPSLYEGFGMVCLDAMSHGCPVVCSRTSALPEVVGEAGILVDPENIDDMARALGKVLGDASLRERLRAEGLERSGFFTWEKTALKTLEAYSGLARK